MAENFPEIREDTSEILRSQTIPKKVKQKESHN